MMISTISAGDVRDAFALLVDDEDFRASRRNKRFLQFVVEETLKGRGERIKAYTIAVDVFGRSADFDPAIDPIVRIEATRLRNALKAYYEGAGSAVELRFSLPIGRYVPEFSLCSREDRDCFLAADYPNALHARVKVLVDICDLSDLSESLAFATDVTIESLRLRDVRVYYGPSARRTSQSRAFDHFMDDPASAFAIDISYRNQSIHWRITTFADSEVLASLKVKVSGDLELFAKDMLATTQQIARIVLGHAAGPPH